MFGRLLVPLDGSALAERALPHAAHMARVFGAELHVLHVLEPPRSGGGASVDVFEWGLQRVESEAYVQAIADALRREGVNAVADVEEGPAAARILEHVREKGVDLLVLTTHGQGGPTGFWAAGTALKLLSCAPVSVLLVPVRDSGEPSHPSEWRRVVAPLDCSRRAEGAARVASHVARSCDAELVLVHVVPVPELTGPLPHEATDLFLRDRLTARNREVAERTLSELRARLAASGAAVRTAITAAEDVAAEIVDATLRENPDLVVAYAQGSQAAGACPCGSATRRLLAATCVPVLLLQHEAVTAGTPHAGDAWASAPADPRVGARGR